MQYKLKHETLAKICNRNIMKIGKRFRKKKRRRKRLMKKIRLLIPLFIGLVAVTAYPAFARSSEEPINVEEVNEANEDVGYFPGCDDDEKVIPLGDGFLGGEAYLQNGDEEICLNSETDSSAITVKEAKEILKSRQAESDNQ